MGDDATRRDYRAQGKQFPADDRIQGLDQIIRVDARIDATQLPGRCRPLQAARLGLSSLASKSAMSQISA
jgi:hypothetical protein